VPLVGERVAAGVAQHVRVGLELQASGRRGALDHPGEAGRGERRSALADEDKVWSVETWRSLGKAQLDKSRSVLLKGDHDLFQFILGKIDPVSLRQVWAAALERQILLDKVFERF
jgi:hypothetical protein